MRASNQSDQKVVTSTRQRQAGADIVHPRAVGQCRQNMFALEYLPHVRAVCAHEKDKQAVCTARRRRATHHFHQLSVEIQENFAASVLGAS